MVFRLEQIIGAHPEGRRERRDVIERKAPFTPLQPAQRGDVDVSALAHLLEREPLFGAKLAQPASHTRASIGSSVVVACMTNDLATPLPCERSTSRFTSRVDRWSSPRNSTDVCRWRPQHEHRRLSPRVLGHLSGVIYDLMMLILYGAMFAAVIVTFLRWGGADEVSESVGPSLAPDVSCIPPSEEAPIIAHAQTSRDSEDVYAEAN